MHAASPIVMSKDNIEFILENRDDDESLSSAPSMFDDANAPSPPAKSTRSKGIFSTISKTTSKVAEDVAEVGKEVISTAALSTMVAAAGKFFQGYSFASTNAALRPLATQMQWCQDSLEPWMDVYGTCPSFTTCQRNRLYTPFITGSATLGGISGAFFAGSIALRGRRFGLIVMNFVALIGLILNTSAVNFTMIFVGRLVLGVAMGSFGFMSPLYVSEVAPPKRRGRYLGITDSFGVGGVLVATLFGLAFYGTPSLPEDEFAICGEDESSYPPVDCGDYATDGDFFCGFEQHSMDKWFWRVVMSGFLIPVIILALILLIFVFTFETPYWCLLKGKFAEAKQVLLHLRDGQDVKEELENTIFFMEQSVKIEAAGEGGGFLAFNKHPNARRALWTGIFLGLGNAITGDIPMSFLTVPLFMDAGLSEEYSIYVSVILMIVQLITVITITFTVDRFGRKPLLIIGCSVQTFALAVPAVSLIINEHSQLSIYLSVAGAMLFTVGCAIGLGSVVYTAIFEMFPPFMKHRATRICVTVTWIGNFFEFLISPLLTTRQLFVKSALLSFGALMVCIFMVKETKGLPVGASPYFPAGTPDTESVNTWNAEADKDIAAFFESDDSLTLQAAGGPQEESSTDGDGNSSDASSASH